MASSGSTQNKTSNNIGGSGNGFSANASTTSSRTDRLKSIKSMFPLQSISDVVKFFRSQLENSDPDLTILSIIAGYIEISLTSSSNATAPATTTTTTSTNASATINETGSGSVAAVDENKSSLNTFPDVTFEIIDQLYNKFQNILSIVEKPGRCCYANRNVIKKISDIIWHSLIRSSYKDRAHLQHLYSYLSGNKLDCFGVAMSVVAGCQMLGYRDVHLAISEDHAWVVFNVKQNVTETIEVTWHGKGHEDKRGHEIPFDSRTWLYLSGHPVICDRYMEVAAIVSAINIALTPNSDCLELADLQQNLLWMLYDLKHLDKYPMSLGNLGELEEVSPKLNRPTCENLYREAIKSSRKYYDNHHVYPYTYQGGFYYRHSNYREAFSSWANAGDVIRLYNYSRDDEEIYKEFMDIANELIPYIMKTESSGHSARSILRDSECFANLIRFYDGICQWEEGSLTPILHIGWAKPLVNTISKFDYDIRSQVIINCAKDDDDITSATSNSSSNMKLKELLNEANNKRVEREKTDGNLIKEALIITNEATKQQQMDEGNNNFIKKEETKPSEDSINNKKSDIPTLADLTAACGEKILNPDFLLQGGGELFADQKQKTLYDRTENNGSSSKITMDDEEGQLTTKHDNMQKSKIINSEKIENHLTETSQTTTNEPIQQKFDYIYVQKNPIITLYSQKMKGLKDLLLSEKLNTHAISLQVTAQSQVSRKKVRGVSNIYTSSSATNNSTITGDKSNLSLANNTNSDSVEQVTSSRPKRTRRE